MIVSATDPLEELYALTWNEVPYVASILVAAGDSVDVPLSPPLMDAVWTPQYLAVLGVSPAGEAADWTLTVSDALTGVVLATFSAESVIDGQPLSAAGRAELSGGAVITLTNTTDADITIELYYGYQR